MTDSVIQLDNLCKDYRKGLAEKTDRTLREVIVDLAAAPWRRLMSLRDGSHGRSEIFHALSDISFSVEAGEVVGLIGRNGAGKSTLLKILSRITRPSSGQAEIRGRVGSLLEVGTGFHPDLTGRENIFMNGAVIGMKKAEIKNRFDEIVAFSGVEEFLDTPVKRYSSGMRVRLGFAVAAHLDTEILFVDEVLAVGDMDFQRRCLGKMGQVARQGRTVMFVSHNMASMATLCKRGLLLSGGKLVFDGPMDKAIATYLAKKPLEGQDGPQRSFKPDETKAVQISSVTVTNSSGEPSLRHNMADSINISFETEVRSRPDNLVASCQLRTTMGTLVLNSFNTDADQHRNAAKPDITEIPPGKYRWDFELPGSLLNSDIYELALNVFNPEVEVFDIVDGINLEIIDNTGYAAGPFNNRRNGVLAPPLPWRCGRISK